VGWKRGGESFPDDIHHVIEATMLNSAPNDKALKARTPEIGVPDPFGVQG